MAAIPSNAFMAAFLPVARASLFPQQVRPVPLLQRLQSSILPAALIPIPGFIGSIWEGILKAVPKKKTSHRKKRQRLLAGKALKDVTFLVKCSACGRPKRAHILCPYCVQSIKKWFGTKLGIREQIQEEADTVVGKVNRDLRLVSKGKIRRYEQHMSQKGQSMSGEQETAIRSADETVPESGSSQDNSIETRPTTTTPVSS